MWFNIGVALKPTHQSKCVIISLNLLASPDWDFMSLYTERKKKTMKRGGKKVTYYEVIGYKNLNQLEKLLHPVMFRHAMDYDINWHFLECDFDPIEDKLYSKAAEGILSTMDARQFVARLPDLQKVVNGSVDHKGNYRSGPTLSCKERKLVETLNMLYERDEGVIVFTNLLYTLDRFRVVAPHTNFKEFHYMSGDSPDFLRKAIAEKMAPGVVLFATMVGGVSLNMQAVNNVVFYDIPWSVGNVLQCVGRVARVDSTYDSQNVYFISVKETIDQYKTALLSSNLHLLKAILGGYGFMKESFTNFRRKAIVDLRKSLLWRSQK